MSECWARLVVGDRSREFAQLVLEEKSLCRTDPSVIEVRTNPIRGVFEERELCGVEDRVSASGVAGVPVRGLHPARRHRQGRTRNRGRADTVRCVELFGQEVLPARGGSELAAPGAAAQQRIAGRA